jgi:hypothetical protein
MHLSGLMRSIKELIMIICCPVDIVDYFYNWIAIWNFKRSIKKF